MNAVERGTVFSSYRGDTVMIVAMDEPDEMRADHPMCEVEYYSPLARVVVGTRKIIALGDLEGMHGSGVVSPSVAISPSRTYLGASAAVSSDRK